MPLLHAQFHPLGAGIAQIVTRPLDERDHFCGNEIVAYPPLSKAVEVQPAYTLGHEFQGEGLNGRGEFEEPAVQVWEFHNGTVATIRIFADSAAFPAIVTEEDKEEMDRKERFFRQVMNHVTDQLWTAGVHHFAVALLHDIVGFVLSQQQAHLKCHERSPER